MKKLLAFCLLSILLSCESKEVETITIKNKYSIELPEFLSKAQDLHNDASLQYQNVFKELYVVVIDEPKQEFAEIASTTEDFSPDLNGYHQILKSSFEEGVHNIDITPTKDIQINGLKAKTFSLTGELTEIPIYYNVAYIEGKDTFYQIITWTLKSSKQKYQEPMEKIIYSFKEIGSGRHHEPSKK